MKQFNILENHDRALVLGDVHGNFDAFYAAVVYAARNDLFIVSLGDIIDYGSENFSSIQLMDSLIESDRGAMVIGNHDFKLYKYLKQREEGDIRIQVKRGLIATVAEYDMLSENEQQEFSSRFRNVFEKSRFHYVTKNTMFVHGGGHRNMWDTDAMNSKLRSRALYGQVYDHDENDYPIRTYGWADEVADHRSVYFGHDIRSTNGITIVGKNENVYSMDTGSSKGGMLSGAVIEYDGTRFIKTEEMSFDK